MKTFRLGVAPIDFKKDEVVEIRGVKMTSTKTQLPYEYFSLPFCQPEAGVTYQQLNLGEVLRGDRIVDTAYDVKMDQRYIFCLYTVWFKYKGPKVFGDFDQKSLVPG